MRCWGLLVGGVLLGSASGCSLHDQSRAQLPARHLVESQQLKLHSDMKIPKGHPAIRDLEATRGHVVSTLGLPDDARDVHVYVFKSMDTYSRYLNQTYPGLPSRRAYFVGTPQELAVFTHWNEQLHDDLRHEYTHGLLHAGYKYVPLWLDEGLAEYFEAAGATPGKLNPNFVANLDEAMSHGWRPNLARLEQLEHVDEMRQIDYEESWAWVHYLLHQSPQSRQILMGYLGELRFGRASTTLASRLDGLNADPTVALTEYLSDLQHQHLMVVRGQKH